VMLNLAITYVIPSWINMKQKDVNVQKTIWTSLTVITAMFIITGLSISIGYDFTVGDGTVTNILPLIQSLGKPRILAKLSVYAFAFVMIIPAIPVNMIIAKENLVQNKLVSSTWASFLSYVMPVLICIPLQTGTYLLPFQTWTSVIFVATSNFVIPTFIYFKCLFFRRGYNENRCISL
jgi:hypothetical protein